ncbi:hypothetical protein [Luteibacter sp.]|jgi:hypothetical protein|uniref:hypothetical protein n=1 Tax=Luteibacter sp. TaxID=1886636 RepID=UPI002F3EC862
MDTKTILAIVGVAGGATLYQASNWWERAYAPYESSEISPDGCIRIDTYRPFWVLPPRFHRIPDSDPAVHNRLGRQWHYPIFKRAYEITTGTPLGESIVYDPAGQKFIDWGDTRDVGRRVVTVNGFPLVDSQRCSDKATLTKLEAHHEQRRQANRPMQEAWEAAAMPAAPSFDSSQ